MEVNYLAVLVATVVGFVIGFVWYLPQVFGTRWMKALGTPMTGTAPEGMGWKMVISLLSALVSAVVLSFFVSIAIAWKASIGTAPSYLLVGAGAGFWVWLGFLATSLVDPVLWQNKPWSLWGINAGYWLVRLVVMGAILGAWM
jgi:hypothetical protein